MIKNPKSKCINYKMWHNIVLQPEILRYMSCSSWKLQLFLCRWILTVKVADRTRKRAWPGHYHIPPSHIYSYLAQPRKKALDSFMFYHLIVNQLIPYLITTNILLQLPSWCIRSRSVTCTRTDRISRLYACLIEIQQHRIHQKNLIDQYCMTFNWI